MKPREFWIKQCDFIPDRAMSSLEAAQCTAGCNHIPIHVREVSSELDAAYEECVKALEDIRYNFKYSEEDRMDRAEEALEAWRKAKE